MNKVGAITHEMQEGGSEGPVQDIHGTVPNTTELNRLVATRPFRPGEAGVTRMTIPDGGSAAAPEPAGAAGLRLVPPHHSTTAIASTSTSIPSRARAWTPTNVLAKVRSLPKHSVRPSSRAVRSDCL